MARALQYAHEQGVLHRDIKPSNLMLDLFGQVWVTDFGLAKIKHEDDITHAGEFVGTMRYTSPEQLRGWSDPRSDVYSLGITALFAVSWLWRRAESGKSDREQALAKAEATAKTLADMILTGSPYESGNYTVHQMLIDYEPGLTEGLDEYPELEAKLRSAMGWVFSARNQLNRAERNLKSALELFDEAGRGQSLDAARARQILANVYQLKRNNDEAFRQLQEVTKIRTRLLGADHKETLRSRVFWLATHREVSTMVLTNEEVLAELDKVAETLSDRLADDECAEIFLHARFYAITILNRLRRFDVSERYSRERLRLQQKLHADEPNHPAIVSALQQESEIKRFQQQFEASLAVSAEAQARTRKWFGEEEVSPQEIDLIIDVAKTYQAAEDYPNMESTARRALDLARKKLSPDHPFVRDSATLLAEALEGLGRNEKADHLRQEFALERGSRR